MSIAAGDADRCVGGPPVGVRLTEDFSVERECVLVVVVAQGVSLLLRDRWHVVDIVSTERVTHQGIIVREHDVRVPERIDLVGDGDVAPLLHREAEGDELLVFELHRCCLLRRAFFVLLQIGLH